MTRQQGYMVKHSRKPSSLLVFQEEKMGSIMRELSNLIPSNFHFLLVRNESLSDLLDYPYYRYVHSTCYKPAPPEIVPEAAIILDHPDLTGRAVAFHPKLTWWVSVGSSFYSRSLLELHLENGKPGLSLPN